MLVKLDIKQEEIKYGGFDEKTYKKLVSIPKTRKPWNELDVECDLDLNWYLDEKIKETILNLPKVNISSWFEVDDNTPDSNYEGFFTYGLDGEQQFYLLECGDELYFCDTQGYEYARYVTRIKKESI